MKSFSALALGVIVGVCGILPVDAAAQFGRENDRARGNQVCVYKDINYFGAEQCYSAGDEIPNLGSQNNSISSIRIYGRATVTVYEKTGFSGHSAQFTSDVSDLGRRMMDGNTSWSDRIDSLRIGGASIVNNRPNPGIIFRRDPPQQIRDGICVYDRPNYQGRSECWNLGQNISDLGRQGNWRGQISSIRIFGPRTVVVVYRDIGYRGASLTVTRDIPDLAAIRGSGRGNANARGRGNGRDDGDWNRQIASVQVQAQR